MCGALTHLKQLTFFFLESTRTTEADGSRAAEEVRAMTGTPCMVWALDGRRGEAPGRGWDSASAGGRDEDFKP